MKWNITTSLAFGFSMGLSCGLLLCLPNNYSIKTAVVKTIDSNVVKKVVDTLQYKSIDTTIVNYPWGREEIYYFKYKDS